MRQRCSELALMLTTKAAQILLYPAVAAGIWSVFEGQIQPAFATTSANTGGNVEPSINYFEESICRTAFEECSSNAHVDFGLCLGYSEISDPEIQCLSILMSSSLNPDYGPIWEVSIQQHFNSFNQCVANAFQHNPPLGQRPHVIAVTSQQLLECNSAYREDIQTCHDDLSTCRGNSAQQDVIPEVPSNPELHVPSFQIPPLPRGWWLNTAGA